MVAVNPVSAPLVGFRRMWVFGSESRLFFQRFQRSILETRWVSHGPWNRSAEAVFAIGGDRTEKLEKLEVAGQSWKPSLVAWVRFVLRQAEIRWSGLRLRLAIGRKLKRQFSWTPRLPSRTHSRYSSLHGSPGQPLAPRHSQSAASITRLSSREESIAAVTYIGGSGRRDP